MTRNAGASIFLTSEDEWYKAAYYDALTTSYFDYPAGTHTVLGGWLAQASGRTAAHPSPESPSPMR